MMTNHGNRITQGQFSFLPDLTDAQITAQIEYALKNNWAISVEYTDDPHPRNTYWEMYGNPMFDLQDAAGVLMELNGCRKTFPSHYIRLMAFDSTRNTESIVMCFIVNRPAKGFTPPNSFFALYARPQGREGVTRLLEGPLDAADYEGPNGSIARTVPSRNHKPPHTIAPR